MNIMGDYQDSIYPGIPFDEEDEENEEDDPQREFEREHGSPEPDDLD